MIHKWYNNTESYQFNVFQINLKSSINDKISNDSLKQNKPFTYSRVTSSVLWYQSGFSQYAYILLYITQIVWWVSNIYYTNNQVMNLQCPESVTYTSASLYNLLQERVPLQMVPEAGPVLVWPCTGAGRPNDVCWGMFWGRFGPGTPETPGSKPAGTPDPGWIKMDSQLATGDHATKDLTPEIKMNPKYYNPDFDKWNTTKLLHAMTAQLSWHVQNFVEIQEPRDA